MRIAAIILALACGAQAARGDVIRVPGDYLNIQVAVNHAVDGDVILIAPGDYAGPVDVGDVSVALIVDGVSARVPRLVIHDLSAGRSVLVRGLGADGAGFAGGPHKEGLVVENNAGHVRLEAATFRGANGTNALADPNAHPGGWAASHVANSVSVSFAHCKLVGGLGASLSDFHVQWGPGGGGAGLRVEDAFVSVTGCEVTGGHAGGVNDGHLINGASGGDGIVQAGGKLYVAACPITAQSGGNGDCSTFSGCGSGGDGGSCIVGSDALQIWQHGNLLHPGAGVSGPGGPGGGGDGTDGLPVKLWDSSSAVVLASTPRGFLASGPLREGDVGTLYFLGQPGDIALLWVSVAPRWEMLPTHDGVFVVDNGAIFNVLLPIGPLPPSGNLVMPFLAPELPAGLDAITLHAQGIFLDAGGRSLLGPGFSIVLLDSAF